MLSGCCAPLQSINKLPKYKEIDVTVKSCSNCAFGTMSNLLFLRHFFVCEQQCDGFKYEEPYSVLGSGEMRQGYTNNLDKLVKKETIKCHSCDYKTKYKKNMNRHVFAKHLTTAEKDLKWYKCECCDYRTSERTRLREHISSKHSETRLKCEFCTHTAKVSKSLAQHIRRKHASNTKVVCKICNLLMETNFLGRHMTIKHADTRNEQYRCETGGFKCVQCDYKSVRLNTMQKHVRAKHLTEEEKLQQWHKCDSCDYQSSEKHKVNEHYFRRHSDKKALDWFQCGDCVYRTKVKSDLAVHVKKSHFLRST